MAGWYNIREYESFVDKSVCDARGISLGNGQIGLPSKLFSSLENFILENRDEGTSALELMSLGAKPGIGRTITARNYVGSISFKDGTTIQIWPKLASGSSSEEEKHVFLKMLQSVMELPMKEFDLASLSTARIGVLEPFIGMFTRAASDLARRGLRGSYIHHEGNETFVKGKIDFAKTFKVNAAHEERIYVHFDEFGVDRPENKLIKSTLNLLRGKTRYPETKKAVETTLVLFADVSLSKDVERDFARCQLDRTMGAYVPLLKWARVFLKGESFTSFKGSEVATSLLFPMETLFESFVAKEVRRAAAAQGWKATAQDTTEYLYSEAKRYRLRPDIVLRHESAKPVVLDTKWKRIGSEKGDDASQADMYQMYAYQHRFKASKAMLVYPRHEGLAMGLKDTYLSQSDGMLDVNTQIFVFDLMNAKQSAEELVRVAVEAG